MNPTLRELFVAHHQGLVRMAGLLVDPGSAEEVVQEAYVKVAGALPRLRSDEAAVVYLRRTVMNLAKSRLRRRRTADRHLPALVGRADTSDTGTDRAAVLVALRTLSVRQQQCLVLRYYGGLTDHEVAASVGVSLGSAKTHLRRGLDALALRLKDYQ